MLPHWIEELDLSTIDDVPGFVTNIPDMMDIEGYIIKFENGQNVKIKTHWYLVQHRAKDSVNSDRRLFETVVADAQDDLRSLFFDDEWVLKRIQWMEDLVGAEYNTMVYVPLAKKVCVGLKALEELPSPKFQEVNELFPVEVLVKE
jgi:hypothetical protein